MLWSSSAPAFTPAAGELERCPEQHAHLRDRLKVHFADLTDRTSVDYLVRELRVAPDRPYVFHLGAQAHVGESFRDRPRRPPRAGGAARRAGADARRSRASSSPTASTIRRGLGRRGGAGRRLPPHGDGRRDVTLIGDEGAPVAALVHDPAALADPGSSTPVAAAAGLAVANVRAAGRRRRRVRDVAASRRRLVEAGDESAAAWARSWRDGPEARLADVAARLERLAADADGEAGRDAAAAHRRGGDQPVAAAGVRPGHPAAHAHGGRLRPALAELAREQSSVPVDVDAPDARFAPAQELVAYFVCSEALANVAKYADASRAAIAVDRDGGRAVGRGPRRRRRWRRTRRGSGLRGLADRVEALGGRLRVESPPGGGRASRRSCRSLETAALDLGRSRRDAPRGRLDGRARGGRRDGRRRPRRAGRLARRRLAHRVDRGGRRRAAARAAALATR